MERGNRSRLATTRWLTRWRTALVALLVGAVGHAASQTRGSAVRYESQKAPFVEALAGFTAAVAGTYGDEGPAILASLDAMQQALERWDASIAAYETALRNAAPGVDAHVTVAAVYLDRGLPMRALPELATAVRLAPAEPQLHALLGLVHGLAGDRAMAGEAYVRATQLAPQEPTFLYELSLHARAVGQLDEADEASRRFQEALHAGFLAPDARAPAAVAFTRPALLRAPGAAPRFPLTRYAEGFRLLRAGAYALAIESFRRSAEADSLNGRPSGAAASRGALARGSAALRRGGLRDALEQLTSAVESMPGNSEAERLLGMAHWADERYELAATHLRAAVALRPEDERARLALADVLVSADQPSAAEQILLDTVAVLPGSGQARFRLGRLYHLTERYPEAIEAFEQAAALEPFAGLDGLYGLIARTSALEQRVDAAIDAYRRQIDIAPNDPVAHRALAGTFFEQARYDEALTEYLAALLVDPDDARAAGEIARIHLERREYAEAVTAARYALRIDGDDREARYALASGLMRLDRREEGALALQEFRRLQQADMASERQAYEMDALRREATLSLERGELGRAIDLRRAIVEREPEVAAAYVDLGVALQRDGRSREAVASLERALSLDPRSDVHRQLAEAYEALGQTARRRQHLEAYERVKEARLRAGAFR